MRFRLLSAAMLFCSAIVNAQSDFICGQVVFSGKHEAVISSEVLTQVTKLNKDFGESFNAGEVIMELDATVPQADYIQAKAELSSAKEELKSLNGLYEKSVIQNRSASVVKAAEENLKTVASLHKSGSVSDIELANARRDYAVAASDHAVVVSEVQKNISAAQLSVARAMRNVASAKKNFESCKIKAPFDGKVAKLYVKQYQQVQPLTELAKLVGDKSLVGRYLLNEKDYTSVHVGDSCRVRVDVIGVTVTGVVTLIDPVIDPASRTFEVRIEVDNSSEQIRPGMMGVVEQLIAK